jgi:hypothetical protein
MILRDAYQFLMVHCDTKCLCYRTGVYLTNLLIDNASVTDCWHSASERGEDWFQSSVQPCVQGILLSDGYLVPLVNRLQ